MSVPAIQLLTPHNSRLASVICLLLMKTQDIFIKTICTVDFNVNCLKQSTLWLCSVFMTQWLPSLLIDSIQVMVIDWRLRGNIIRTALCWIVWHSVHSQQHTYVSSSYRFNRLGLSHWDPYTVHRSGIIVTWWSGSGGIQAWSPWPTGFLQYFDTVGLIIWPIAIVPEMTYNVLSGTFRRLYTTTTTWHSDFNHYVLNNNNNDILKFIKKNAVCNGDMQRAAGKFSSCPGSQKIPVQKNQTSSPYSSSISWHHRLAA